MAATPDRKLETLVAHTTRTWVLVADAGSSRTFLRETASGPLVELAAARFDNPASHGHARDLGTDRPARIMESASSARHAAEPRVDLHRQAKADFAKRLADWLEDSASKQQFDRLILVAPPQMLGDLRAALGKRTAAIVVGTVDKDLTKMSGNAIQEHLPAAAKS